MKFYIHKKLGLTVVILLLGVIVLAACGGGSPAESPALGDLRINSATTGQDLIGGVSEGEASCISSSMGEAGYQTFQGAPLMTSAADASLKSLFGDCLEDDNISILTARLISARLNGWSEGSLNCVSDQLMEHPEFAYLALGLEKEITDPSHPTEVHSSLLEIYECLDTMEKAGFLATMIPHVLEGGAFTGQDLLDALPESEVECMRANLPGPVFAMIAGMPSVAGGELRAAPPELIACISAESISGISGRVMAKGMGADSEDSRTCLIEFSIVHTRFSDLMRTASTNPTALSTEDYVEIAEDGWSIFNCLTVEELSLFQKTYMRYLVL